MSATTTPPPSTIFNLEDAPPCGHCGGAFALCHGWRCFLSDHPSQPRRSDPAVEAVQKVLGNVSPDAFSNEVADTALAAVRAALARVQEWHATHASDLDPEAMHELAEIIYARVEHG